MVGPFLIETYQYFLCTTVVGLHAHHVYECQSNLRLMTDCAASIFNDFKNQELDAQI